MGTPIPVSESSFRGIPPVTNPKFLDAVKEVLEILIGQRGTGADRAATLKDLAGAGMVKYLNDQVVSVTRPAQGVPAGDAPEPPYNLELLKQSASDRITALSHHMQWDLPVVDSDIVATQIWAAVDSNSRASATHIGVVTFPNNTFVNQDPDPSADYYYWIRTVAWNGLYSEWDPSGASSGMVASAAGTIDDSVNKLLEVLKGENNEQAYNAGTTYQLDDRIKFEGSDGVDRNYKLIKDEPELVTNGTFENGSSWTTGAGWSISGGAAHRASAGASLLEQTISFANGVSYTVQFTVTSYTAGTITAKLNGTSGTARSAVGTYIETISAGASGGLDMSADASFIGSIDNIIITLVSGGSGVVGMSPTRYWPRWWERIGVISQGQIDGVDIVGIDGNMLVSGTINAGRVAVVSDDGKTIFDGDSIDVYDETNQLRVKLGRLS
jgi:hypothetical protein